MSKVTKRIRLQPKWVFIAGCLDSPSRTQADIWKLFEHLIEMLSMNVSQAQLVKLGGAPGADTEHNGRIMSPTWPGNIWGTHSAMDYKVKIPAFVMSTATINVLSPVFYCTLYLSQLSALADLTWWQRVFRPLSTWLTCWMLSISQSHLLHTKVWL